MRMFNCDRLLGPTEPSYWDPNNATGNYGPMAQGMYVEVGGIVSYKPYPGSVDVVFKAEDRSLHNRPFFMLNDDTTATGVRAMYELPGYISPG